MSASPCFALLRGINLGRRQCVPMAELRRLLESLGCIRVRTLLNSGNAVFEAQAHELQALGPALEAGLRERFGFQVPVVVGRTQALERVIVGNPLPGAVRNPGQFLVAFPTSEKLLDRAEPLRGENWRPEELALAEGVAYLHCAVGIRASRLLRAFNRVLGNSVTTRNWATILKIWALHESQRTIPG
ncbi:DUF1697 domain-containing protein [Azohydromonas caseinilytica]|uniref:DUF1697 domain-containing protein n=1 Tax=Azohydromonas caseinilytica TaxID=2728836 RepID=A0A848F9E3_9BURK|nr:DUF1697 domain-containing protein [Azohydromonas caseinilytica]NML15878.1 DUF1697 domain-containing protein [Azohydromonas caseinilytica]